MYVCIYAYVWVVYEMYIIQNKTKKIIFLKGDLKKIQTSNHFRIFCQITSTPVKSVKAQLSDGSDNYFQIFQGWEVHQEWL